MLLLCDDSIVLPLRLLIFQNILSTGIFPELWKRANITPIHKKGDKQIIKNYRPISLLPICSKLFEKIIFNNIYNFLNSSALLTKNQSGFRPGDSTINQLINLVNDIHISSQKSYYKIIPTLKIWGINYLTLTPGKTCFGLLSKDSQIRKSLQISLPSLTMTRILQIFSKKLRFLMIILLISAKIMIMAAFYLNLFLRQNHLFLMLM